MVQEESKSLAYRMYNSLIGTVQSFSGRGKILFWGLQWTYGKIVVRLETFTSTKWGQKCVSGGGFSVKTG